ncbi:unnamed protein product [Allacma fusca]|uniref:Fork-head domain-containing protein n=1 Tax=Allacma fusca TaxID=39272 RepID=A0A8J2KTS1_9HEXA|nr:unnamed protein product [Allacma fusca]
MSNTDPRPQFNPVPGVGLVSSVPVSSSGMSNSSVGMSMPGLLSPSSALEHYRLSQLYQYAMAAERLRCPPGSFLPPIPSGLRPELAPFLYGPYCRMDPRLALCRPPEEPKPQHSYIGLIAMAILSSSDKKLVLSDIYQYILDNYPYFRSRGPGWRNSIRHNLSLNDCFIKAGRSANGKGHYWAIHPANVDDFTKGDFRRRKAQRKVRRHMGLAVDDDDSPSPPPTSPPPAWSTLHHPVAHLQPHPVAMALGSPVEIPGMIFGRPNHTSMVLNNRKRQFDVASLLAPEKESLNESISLSLKSTGDSSPTSMGRKNFKKSSDSDEDEIEVCGNECKTTEDPDSRNNFTQDTDTEETSCRRRHNCSQDADESSSNDESDDNYHCKVPAGDSSGRSEDLNNRSYSPKTPEDPHQGNPLGKESCGPINPTFSPADFLSSQQFIPNGLAHQQTNPNPFSFPGNQHPLLHHNPSIASLMILSSKYREIASNMAKRSSH